MSQLRDMGDVVRRARRRWGASKTAARRIGIPLDVYVAHRSAGQLWCCHHRRWELAERFRPGRRQCAASSRVAVKRDQPLTDAEVILMRQLKWIGRMPYRALCRMFGVSYRAAWAACNGETWTHLPMPGGFRGSLA